MPSPQRSLANAAGVRIELTESGAPRRMFAGDVLINLFPGNELEGGPANLWLRRRGRNVSATPLLGPHSPARRVAGDGVRAVGEWQGIEIAVSLVLAASETVWAWYVDVVNRGRRGVALDLVHAQDVGLAHYGFARLNEYYVSQYVDFVPLRHQRQGTVLAMRQNLAMGGRHPWLLIGSLRHGDGFATDALQLYGTAARGAARGAPPAALGRRALPSRRLQHEHALAVLQDAPLRLAAGAAARLGFFACFVADHPAPSGEGDLCHVDRALEILAGETVRGAARPGGLESAGAVSVFCRRPVLAAVDLEESEITELFGSDRCHAETRAGRLQSFFTAAGEHVVLADKERSVLRPHGRILRSGDHLTPDESSLTTTVWMGGVFNSMLTQGHVSINRFLSTTHSYLGLFRSHGQRLFVELEDGYHLLDLPSAFSMTAASCRWIYKHAGGRIEVQVAVGEGAAEVAVTVRCGGVPRRLLWTHHVALNGDDGADPIPARHERDGEVLMARHERDGEVVMARHERDGEVVMARHERVGEVVIVRPIPDSDVGRRFAAGSFRIVPGEGTVFEQVGGDELLFEDRRSRDQPFVAVVTAPAPVAELRIVADLLPPAAAPPVPGARALARRVAAIVPPAASALAPAARELAAIVPWLVQDALVHYLAPRGLEQYSGGGWGTRDVCQGPVEMLLALGEPAPVRDVLWRVFAAQNAAGDWPQWFMFFERERDIRPAEAHGDVVFWPLLALGRYLEATGDAAILDEPVPFFDGAPASVWEHVERALAVVAASALPGTRLTALGHGDWNDSLQPVDPAMRQRLCSAWTATLHREAFLTLAAGIQHHRAADAERLREIAAAVADDFRRLLVVDGVVAGFADLGGDAGAEYLLHPRDRATGVHYRLLPMIHAIAGGLLTPEQARRHVDLIADHLLGRDGARLFDRPPRYQGGSQRIFQRAESSTFFGREIGLMYMHAHLRYAQAMAYYGDADAFFLALRQANPIGVASVVAGARPRQANCYTSSSDAVFADRYAAAADYGRVRRGGVDFEGGWRVYSSGAGIMVRLVHECLLGVRRSTAVLTLDPVIPAALDGLRAEVAVGDAAMSIEYRVARHGRGPRRLELNGEPLAFEREPNPYRPGAAVVPLAGLRARLRGDGNELIVDLD